MLSFSGFFRDGPAGKDGKTPEIRLDGKVLRYRYEGEGDDAWQTIFDFSTVETVKGDPGDTPYIGANGNWFIGDTDTGVKAKGDKGDTPTVPAVANTSNVATIATVAIIVAFLALLGNAILVILKKKKKK